MKHAIAWRNHTATVVTYLGWVEIDAVAFPSLSLALIAWAEWSGL